MFLKIAYRKINGSPFDEILRTLLEDPGYSEVPLVNALRHTAWRDEVKQIKKAPALTV